MRSAFDVLPARPRGRRLAAVLVTGALALAACGGGDSSDEAGATDAAATDADTAVDASVETAAVPEGAASTDAEAPADAGGAAAATGAGLVDLVGPDVVADAEIETNRLPSVVLDDVTNDRKVNFRNLVPQDRPILLWMYAPH